MLVLASAVLLMLVLAFVAVLVSSSPSDILASALKLAIVLLLLLTLVLVVVFCLALSLGRESHPRFVHFTPEQSKSPPYPLLMAGSGVAGRGIPTSFISQRIDTSLGCSDKYWYWN